MALSSSSRGLCLALVAAFAHGMEAERPLSPPTLDLQTNDSTGSSSSSSSTSLSSNLTSSISSSSSSAFFEEAGSVKRAYDEDGDYGSENDCSGAGRNATLGFGTTFIVPGCGGHWVETVNDILSYFDTDDKKTAEVTILTPSDCQAGCAGGVRVCNGNRADFASCFARIGEGPKCDAEAADVKMMETLAADLVDVERFHATFSLHSAGRRPLKAGNAPLVLNIVASSGGSKPTTASLWGAEAFVINFPLFKTFFNVAKAGFLPPKKKENQMTTKQCGYGCVDTVYYGAPGQAKEPGQPEYDDEGFLSRLRRWQLILGIANRLEDEEKETLLSTFHENTKTVVAEAMKDSGSLKQFDQSAKTLQQISKHYSQFIQALRPVLYISAQTVGVPAMTVLAARYLKLPDRKTLLTEDDRTKDDNVRSEMAKAMRRFILDTQFMECSVPLFSRKTWRQFWSGWQDAQGHVRVYVRFTTPCRVPVPPDTRFASEMKTSYTASVNNDGFDGSQFGNQRYWDTCKQAREWPTNQFPSAVLSCSRRDDWNGGPPGQHLHLDGFVRYTGCGSQRLAPVTKDLATRLREAAEEQGGSEEQITARFEAALAGRTSQYEPYVANGLREYCLPRGSGDPSTSWNSGLCPANMVDSEDCRIYGPFWGIYAAPAYRLFGVKSNVEENMITNDKLEPIDAVTDDKVKWQGRSPGKTIFTKQCTLPQDPVNGAKHCGNPQTEGFKALLNEAAADYVYGSNPDVPHPKRSTQSYYPMPFERSQDPPLREVLEEVQSGGTVVMMAYGFSGAGKTTTLIGNSSPKINGVLSHFLAEKSRVISKAHITVVEVYGRVKLEDGSISATAGSGLWAFDTVTGKAYLVGADKKRPGWKAFTSEKDPDKTDLGLMKQELLKYRRTITGDVNEGIQRSLELVEKARKDPKTFESFGMLAHIRATSNNPSSSRGALFIMMDFEFTNQKTGTVVVVDLAGAEDPAEMLKGFGYVLEPDQVPDVSVAGDGNACNQLLEVKKKGLCKGDRALRENLHRVSRDDFWAGEEGQCLRLKNYPLDKCKDTELEGCVYLNDGYFKGLKAGWWKLNQNKPADEISRSFLFHGRAKMRIPTDLSGVNTAKPRFGVPKMVLKAALVDGNSTTGDVLDYEAIVSEYLEKTANGECNALKKWGELWGVANGKGAVCGKSGGMMGKDIDDWDTALSSIPSYKVAKIHACRKMQAQMSGFEEKFCKDLAVCTMSMAVKQAKLDAQARRITWDSNFGEHLDFFKSVANALVEEAVYINEMLNQLRLWLASVTNDDPNFGKGSFAQPLDFSPTAASKDPYSLTDLIKAKGAKHNFFEERLIEGKDRFIGISLLEMLRQEKDKKNFWILFGTFARTDMPNGDPDCLGAQRALQFAETLLPKTTRALKPALLSKI